MILRLMCLAGCAALTVLGAPAMFVPGPGHTFTARNSHMAAVFSTSMVTFQARGAGPAVRLKFARARRIEPEGLEPLEAHMNFLIGSDPGNWRTNVPVFGRVRYRQVWPGIDLIFYGGPDGIEYDAMLSSGADARRVQFLLDGGRIDGEDIVVTNGGTVLRHGRPIARQGGHEIAAHYVRRSGGRIGIELAPYDRNRELIIDPVITYATYLGGGNAAPASNNSFLSSGFIDRGNAIAMDAAGNAYVTGVTTSLDFPVTGGAYQVKNPRTGPGLIGSAFVAKIDPTGAKLLYATFLSGNDGAAGQGIAVDASGAAYIGGFSYGADFPLTPDAALSKPQATGNVGFVAKLSADGSRLIYSTFVNGGEVTAVALDSSGNAYGISRVGSLSKINPAGTAFVYTKAIVAADLITGTSTFNAIAVDPAGNAYLAGSTFLADFPVTAGAIQSKCSCSSIFAQDAFLVKVDAAGRNILYATFLGGQNNDSAAAIALDATGSVYLAGTTSSVDFPVTAGAFSTKSGVRDGYGNVITDAFVAKIDSSGKLVYSTFLGGEYGDQAGGIAIDASGAAVILGTTSSLQFPITPDALSLKLDKMGRGYAFLTLLDATGSRLLYSTLFGGNGPDQGNAVAIGPGGDIYITGTTSSDDLPVTPGAIQSHLANGVTNSSFQEDAFVARIAMGDIFHLAFRTQDRKPDFAHYACDSATDGHILWRNPRHQRGGWVRLVVGRLIRFRTWDSGSDCYAWGACSSHLQRHDHGYFARRTSCPHFGQCDLNRRRA